MKTGSNANRKITMIAGIAIMLCILAVSIAIAVGGNRKNRVTEQLELGAKYLSELDYENAIAAYEAAIEIEPKNENAYRGLAEVYVAMGDYEAAIDVLNEGIEQTGSEELADYLANVQKAYEVFLASQNVVENFGSGKNATAEEFSNESVEEITYNVYEYDASGNMVRVTYYDINGEISYWYIYEYGDDGNRSQDTRYNNDGEIVSWVEPKYDADGKEIRFTYYDADGKITGWVIMEYDADGKEIQSVDYVAGGEEYSRCTYRYDDDGKLIELVQSYVQEYGMYATYTSYEYDENGNRVKSILATDFGGPSTITVYEYDANGNLEKISQYNGKKISHINIYEYDGSGNLIKVTTYRYK